MHVHDAAAVVVSQMNYHECHQTKYILMCVSMLLKVSVQISVKRYKTVNNTVAGKVHILYTTTIKDLLDNLSI